MHPGAVHEVDVEVAIPVVVQKGPAAALGLDADDMQVEVNIGVPKPDQVDTEAVLAVLPHGTGTVNVVEGGLEISDQTGTGSTVIANAAAIVRLDLP